MTEVINPNTDNVTPTVDVDNKPAATNYTDGFSYEVPRPFLTLPQAASVLGMTLRSLERSVNGRWGNKLPDGWLARRMKTAQGDEWRILPPPGFRVKLNAATEYGVDEENQDPPLIQPSVVSQPSPAADPLGFYTGYKRKPMFRPERHSIDQPTIVIDRSEEVEHLLRELVATKSALAEERRVHMEDMRMITQLQGSMRLLEVNANEQAKVKAELDSAKQELTSLKAKYNAIINAPWWRRLFGKRNY